MLPLLPLKKDLELIGTFTENQKAAIINLLYKVGRADGKLSSNESVMIAKCNQVLELNLYENSDVIDKMFSYSLEQLIEIVKPLTREQHEFIIRSVYDVHNTDMHIEKTHIMYKICNGLSIIKPEELDSIILQTDSPASVLDEHMKSFDNLGFNNEKVYNWRKSILKTLEDNDCEMSSFYFSNFNTNNKELLQHIAFKENTYNFLNSKGLVNTGFCPITGEKINNTFNFNLYNRVVYLSKKGVEVCESINRKDWNNNKSSIDYDTFQNLKKQQSSSCYIATACYGSIYADEVNRFREYRDRSLVSSWLGRIFIAFYYFTSPPIARVIAKHEWMKKIVRKFLLSPILKRLPKAY